jgi:hypothetical protein
MHALALSLYCFLKLVFYLTVEKTLVLVTMDQRGNYTEKLHRRLYGKLCMYYILIIKNLMSNFTRQLFIVLIVVSLCHKYQGSYAERIKSKIVFIREDYKSFWI